MDAVAELVKMTDHIKLWYTKLAWYSPSATSLEHNLWIEGIRPCLIVEVLATQAKFFQPSGYCTVINSAFSVHATKLFHCSYGVVALFELANSWSRRDLFDIASCQSIAQCRFMVEDAHESRLMSGRLKKNWPTAKAPSYKLSPAEAGKDPARFVQDVGASTQLTVYECQVAAQKGVWASSNNLFT